MNQNRRKPGPPLVINLGGMQIKVALKYIFKYHQADHMELRQYR